MPVFHWGKGFKTAYWPFSQEHVLLVGPSLDQLLQVSLLNICIRPWPSGDHFFRDIKCVQCNFLAFGIDLLGLLQRLKYRLENGSEHRNTALVWELMLRSSRGLQSVWELKALPPSCPPHPRKMPLRTPPPPLQTITRSVVAEPEYAAPFLLGLASAIQRLCQSGVIQRKRTNREYMWRDLLQRTDLGHCGARPSKSEIAGPEVRKAVGTLRRELSISSVLKAFQLNESGSYRLSRIACLPYLDPPDYRF